MKNKNWMRFETSGRVDDYLAYCQSIDKPMPTRSSRNEDEDLDESECYPDRDGFDFHARGGV